jgi:hypothetical protein
MTLKITPAAMADAGNRSLFISASIPDPERWEGEFDALEITDAVVSLARVFLTSGWRLVTAAHPTIAPLLLYVAAELHTRGDRRISIYQSELFEYILPTATRRFEAQGIGKVVWTGAVEGDRPVPGKWDRSLEVMRRQMLTETQPAAAVFVGGMHGIPEEYALFSELRPGRPTYAVGHPGGAARALAYEQPVSTLRDQLLDSAVYPALWRAVLHGLEAEDVLFRRFQNLRATGVNDPDVDLALAILEPGPETPERLEEVKKALERGADPNRPFEDTLKKYASESDATQP